MSPLFSPSPPTSLVDWRPLLRDISILIFLAIVTFQLVGQAGEHQPAFTAGDIRTIEAPIAGFATVDVSEEVPGRSRREQLYTRSAIQLAGYPPNLRFYIPGSRWQMEHDIPVGTVVHLEVTDDPAAQIARARAYPNATYAQPIAGLQIGDRVYFRASDTIARAEQAANRYQSLSMVALVATGTWGGWIIWSRRREIADFREWIRGS